MLSISIGILLRFIPLSTTLYNLHSSISMHIPHTTIHSWGDDKEICLTNEWGSWKKRNRRLYVVSIESWIYPTSYYRKPMLAQFRKHKELISKSSIPCLFLNFFTTLGMDKTIQRGDLGKHGILFKIVPMHSEMKPSNKDFMSCWYKPVPKWLPRAGQSVIPTNLSEFKVRTDK